MAKLYIICNNQVIDRGFDLLRVAKCTEEVNIQLKKAADEKAEKGNVKPAVFGYVMISGIGNTNGGYIALRAYNLALCADTQEELAFIYTRCVDAILNHPNAIDLRHDTFDIRIL